MALRRLTVLSRRRVVLLDALGTLVELDPPAPRLREELRERFGLSISQAVAQRAIAAEMTYYRAHLHEGRDEPALAELRRRCAEVMWHELADVPRAPQPDPSEAVEVLMSSLRFRAFPDAPVALSAMKELGLVLVVTSNWDVSLPGVLERVGLAAHLDGVVTSAGVGAAKPDPAIFREALRVAGATAEETIHVGDNSRDDVEGARSAGIDAVLLVRPGGAVSADVPQIHSLGELPALLGAMAER